MQKTLNKICSSGFLVLSLALLFTCTLLAAMPTPRAMAAQGEIAGTWLGRTTAIAHVRAGPGIAAPIVYSLPVGTQVMVYATARGQVMWDSIADWYVISSPGSALEYVYAGLVSRSSSMDTALLPSLAYTTHKRVVVSLSQQWLYTFDDDREVRDTAVTTGQPGMDTPIGTYHVFSKLTATTFYSPMPANSAYYYAPTYINYALGFREGGYFIHDAIWRSDFGPHTNTRHYDHVYGWETGSHGCVNLPLSTMTWLYNWATIGTTIQVVQ